MLSEPLKTRSAICLRVMAAGLRILSWFPAAPGAITVFSWSLPEPARLLPSGISVMPPTSATVWALNSGFSHTPTARLLPACLRRFHAIGRSTWLYTSTSKVSESARTK
jgi:hypothetical protein